MNKHYENPEAKVICFEATEKLALLEHDTPTSRSLIDASSKIEQDKT